MGFKYYVSNGETTNGLRLDALHNSSLFLFDDNAIYDMSSGMDATLNLPIGNSLGSLSSNVAIQIRNFGFKFPPLDADPNALPAPDPSDVITFVDGSGQTAYTYKDLGDWGSDAGFQLYVVNSASHVTLHDQLDAIPHIDYQYQKSWMGKTSEFIASWTVSAKSALAAANQQSLSSSPSHHVARSFATSFTSLAALIPRVQVLLQINSIFGVDTAAQTFRADILLVTQWFDAKYKKAEYPYSFENSTSLLNKIWHPRLTFVNNRDKPTPFDSKVVTYNTGTIQLWERYLGQFASPINVAAYPFDSQTFYFAIRSISYNSTQLTFAPLDVQMLVTQERIINNLHDATFDFSNYQQSVGRMKSGLLAGYDILKISITAKRLATYNSINLLFPLTLICIGLMATYLLPLRSSARVSMPVSALGATLAFSLVLSQSTPPVSYVTRMSLFIFQTYLYGIFALLSQSWIFLMMDGIKSVTEEKKKRNEKEWKDDDLKWKDGVLEWLPSLKWLHQQRNGQQEKEKDQTDKEKEKGKEDKKGDKDGKEKKKEAEKPNVVIVFHYVALNEDTVDCWESRMGKISFSCGMVILSCFLTFTVVILIAPI